MSRPAFRPQRNRTTDCPTCESPRWHPCYRLDASKGDNGWTVTAHTARRRAEAALREEKARAKT